MIIIGLTGSMASGKSSLIRRIRTLLKWPIWDADAEVQKLYRDHFIIQRILHQFPSAATNQELDRQKLRQAVSEDPTSLAKLESILYPDLGKSRRRFLCHHLRLRTPVIILDIPLLFENNLESICDLTVVIKCSDWLQKQRIMKRPGMTEFLMQRLLANQTSQREKQRRADIIIDSSLNHHHTWIQFMTMVVGEM
ncbi:dephospho-CoA kinase [Candidatus Odyssella acanthamoebae]|uniref:dephospho-CoA kinase n=1 Tax=Candidatus Odyssella acanthamoebae TaxID=91604 RepID=UPI00068D8376|nr:dephospho-CoA kinase [Candidatus Paracaedibacter acanthamoebae]